MVGSAEFDARWAVPAEMPGPRVVVRPYRLEDLDEFAAAMDESRRSLLPWMVWAKEPSTRAGHLEVLSRLIANWHGRNDMTMGIFDRATGRLLGATGLHRINWDLGSYEIGYWVRTSETGKGYVTEAVQVQTATVFERLRANRVRIECAVANEPSNRIPRRLGFVHEGTLRRAIVDADGQYHDLNVYALTRDDWPATAERWAEGSAR